MFTRITWALCLALSEGHSFQDGNFCRLEAVSLISLDLFTEFAQKRCLLESSRNPVKDINSVLRGGEQSAVGAQSWESFFLWEQGRFVVRKSLWNL